MYMSAKLEMFNSNKAMRDESEVIKGKKFGSNIFEKHQGFFSCFYVTPPHPQP